MNILAMIRRIIWGIILSICATVTLLYFVISNTFLTGNGLSLVISSSNTAQTVRDTVLLPKILNTVHSSKYANFLDDATVTKAFKEAATVDAINNKLTPAITSFQAWLNSKQPTITFTLDTSDISTQFIDRLSAAAGDKYAALPTCTLKNTLADATGGVCKSPLMSQAVFVAAINVALKTEAAVQPTSLTQDSIPLFSYLEYIAHNLPDYLNIFYGLSIITGGIAILIIIWLLFKHRLAGIATIGMAGMLTGLLLFMTAITLPHILPVYSSQPLADELLRSAAHLFADNVRHLALFVTLGGFVLSAIMLIILTVMSRRRQPQQKLHLSTHKDEQPLENK
jgi:hypothetical protein